MVKSVYMQKVYHFSQHSISQKKMNTGFQMCLEQFFLRLRRTESKNIWCLQNSTELFSSICFLYSLFKILILTINVRTDCKWPKLNLMPELISFWLKLIIVCEHVVIIDKLIILYQLKRLCIFKSTNSHIRFYDVNSKLKSK